MQITGLFPTALGIFELGRSFTGKEIKFIKNQEMHRNIGNKVSDCRDMLDAKELKNIKTFVDKSIQHYFQNIYAPKQNTKLRITQSWCNYTEPGQHHHRHAHPNSFISGVLYIQANPDIDRINFYRSGWQQLRTPPGEFNPYNSDSWWMEAGAGTLFLFPSSLEHMVEPVQGDQTRISLSFNTFPIGNFGDATFMTGLDL